MTFSHLPQDEYLQAGVDVKKAENLVRWLLPNEISLQKDLTYKSGAFAGTFPFPLGQYKNPVLLASTDGVGTKLLLGLKHNRLHDIGQDLVAMCVNDLYTTGGKPLFFLDYYATGTLDEQQFKTVLLSIKRSLSLCGCQLLGGETAEMPGLYKKGDLDLAGFVVGVVEQDQLIDGTSIKEGDDIYAAVSSGFHSNGYSLIRHWLEEDLSLQQNELLISRLLVPTTIYADMPLLNSRNPRSIHGVAHITGGGITGNITRIIPEGLTAVIDPQRLPTQEWMTSFLLSKAPSLESFAGIFNLGCGLLIVASKGSLDQENIGNSPLVKIGHIEKSSKKIIYLPTWRAL